MANIRKATSIRLALIATSILILGLADTLILMAWPKDPVQRIDVPGEIQGRPETNSKEKAEIKTQDPARPNVQIEKAIFGTGRGSQNVTGRIREIVKNTKAVTTISTTEMKIKNPSGRFRDKLKIDYGVSGTKGYLEIKNGAKVNIYQAIVDHNRQTYAIALTKQQEDDPERSIKVALKKLDKFKNFLNRDPNLPNTTPDPSDPSTSHIEMPRDVKQEEVFALPGRFETMCTGGGGRYLIFNVKEKHILCIFDVTTRQMIKEIPVPDDVLIAAGRKKLLIAIPSNLILRRFDFLTLDFEKNALLETENIPKYAAMGCNSDGPLLLFGNGGVQFWDCDLMKPIDSKVDGKLPFEGKGNWSRMIAASANGRFFTTWDKLLEFDNGIKQVTHIGDHTPNQRIMRPNNDGSRLFGFGNAVSVDLQQNIKGQFGSQALFQCVDPRYVLGLANIKGTIEPAIYTANDMQQVIALKRFDYPGLSPSARNWETVGYEACVRYLPEFKTVVCINNHENKITIRSFNLKAELESTKEKYLYIDSKPNTVAFVGQRYQYQLTSLSDSPVTYKLLLGPKEMSVSADGRVEWIPPDALRGKQVPVHIEATNSDHATYLHSYILKVNQSETDVSDPEFDSVTDEPDRGHEQNKDEYVVQLPHKCDVLRFGGNGRYAVLQSKSQNKLYVVDTYQKKLVKELNTDGDLKYACSLDKLVIVYPSRRTIERWDLGTFEREDIRLLPPDVSPFMITMGDAGNGPLGMWINGSLQLWDINKLERISLDGPTMTSMDNAPHIISVSSKGHTFCSYPDRTGFFSTLQVSGNKTKVFVHDQLHYGLNNWGMPNEDGRMLLTFGGKVYDSAWKQFATPDLNAKQVLPSGDSRFLLLVEKEENDTSKATICSTAELKQIHTIEQLPDVTKGNDPTTFGRFSLKPRVRLLFDQNLFVIVPESNDRVVMRAFNLQKEIATKPEPHFFVTSQPKNVAFVGDQFTYQVETLTNAQSVGFSLVEAPSGMEIDNNGLIRWPIEKRPLGGHADVTVLVKPANGIEGYFRISIEVQRKLLDSSLALESTDKGPWFHSGKDLGYYAVDDRKLEFPYSNAQFSSGLKGRILMLAGQDLCILKPDGLTIEKIGRLENEYKTILERDGYFVAIARNQYEICLIDKLTLSVTKKLRLPCRGIMDVVIHPSKPYSFVTIKSQSGMPFNRIVRFDERSGEGLENDNWAGNFLAMDSSGEFMYAAYIDHSNKDGRLRMDPKVWKYMPMPGSISWIIKYKFDDKTMPIFHDRKPDLSMVVNGLELSNDGKRIVQLSQRGFPDGSFNLAGWETDNFQKVPAVYLTKDIGNCRLFKFHPHLPIAVSAKNNSLVFFDANSGEIQTDRVEDSIDLLSDTIINNICFSPDGKNLTVVGTQNGVHYLYRLPLRLTQDEQTQNTSRFRSAFGNLDN
jgi:WD40 repeat protein